MPNTKVKMPALPPQTGMADSRMSGYGRACAEAMREACAKVLDGRANEMTTLATYAHIVNEARAEADAMADRYKMMAKAIRALEVEQP